MSLDEILFVSWDETSKNTSDRGKELRFSKKFWRRTIGIIQTSGINSHVFKGDDCLTRAAFRKTMKLCYLLQ